MKKTRSLSKIILTVFAVSLLSMFFVSSAPAATTMVLTPSTQTVDPGDTFTVDIVVTPDTPIAGVQFDINWNPDLLEFDGWTEGDLLSQDPPGCGTFVSIMGGLYQDQGFIDGLAGVVLGAGCEVSGQGIFATLTFTAEASGTSPLDLSDVIVGDLTGTEVPSTVTSGDVVITGSGPPPAPDLVISEMHEETTDPTYSVVCTVTNNGDVLAPASITSLTIDGTPAATQGCPALDPGASHIQTFADITCSDAMDTIIVCADFGGMIEESNEANNCDQDVRSCAGLLFDIKNGAGMPGDTGKKVEVCLTNEVAVGGIQVDITNGQDVLSLPLVTLTDRTAGYTVDLQDDYPVAGCARIILFAQSGAVIAAGDGPIFTLNYDVDAAATQSCVGLSSGNLLITDPDDLPLTAGEDPGIFFLGLFGDVYPLSIDGLTVGDGLINIFDVVRDIQIILADYTPNDCEFTAGDVPTGTQAGGCAAPDAEINISDVMAIVQEILGRDNCLNHY